jgi:hypothetical protein
MEGTRRAILFGELSCVAIEKYLGWFFSGTRVVGAKVTFILDGIPGTAAKLVAAV